MSVLAIDTAGRHRAVAVLVDGAGQVLATALSTGSIEELIGGLPPLLGADLHAVVAVTGPGSFTGLRAGIASALGVAAARGLPLHGVGTLEVVAAAQAKVGEVTAAADAGRGAHYVARYRVERDSVTELEPARRAAGAPPPGARLLGADDHPAALARAVAVALARPPLDQSRLRAVYLDPASGSEPRNPRL